MSKYIRVSDRLKKKLGVKQEEKQYPKNTIPVHIPLKDKGYFLAFVKPNKKYGKEYGYSLIKKYGKIKRR